MTADDPLSLARVALREKEAAPAIGIDHVRSAASHVLEIALLATWIWVAVSVILRVYRSPDLAPAAKAGWIFVIVLIPLLGVMIYVDRAGRQDAPA